MSSPTNNTTKEENKTEALYQLLLIAFDVYRKNTSKRDTYSKDLKEAYNQLKECQDFNTPKQITFFTTVLVHSLSTKTIKIIEKTIATTEAIIVNNLLDNKTMKQMILNMITILYECIKMDDEMINLKILNLWNTIYSNSNVAIHGKGLVQMIQIGIYLFLLTKTSQCQTLAKNSIHNLIDIMLYKIEEVSNQTQVKTPSKRNSLFHNQNNIIKHEEIVLMVNEYNYITGKYLSFMTDLVSISNSNGNEKNAQLIQSYISIIQQQHQLTTEDGKPKMTTDALIKQELEALGLDKEENTIQNESGILCGKYGWCISCRRKANLYSETIHYPICSIQCQSEIEKMNKQIENEHLFITNDYCIDYLYILNYLSGISMTDSQNQIEQLQLRNKELCLEMIQILVSRGGKYFFNDTSVLKLIKDSLMDTLVKNTLSSDISIFKLSIRIFITILRNFREHLKDQMQIFIRRILISILESENLGFVYKDIILDSLIELSKESYFLIEVYINYDCDVDFTSVFSELIDLLTKIINGLYKKQKYANIFKPMQEGHLRSKCIECFVALVKNLNMIVEKNEYEAIANRTLNDGNNNNNNAVEESMIMDTEDMTNISSMDQSNSVIGNSNSNSVNVSSSIDNSISEKINFNLKRKAILSKAIDKFNISPNKCLAFLQKNEMIIDESTFNLFKAKYTESFKEGHIKRISDCSHNNNNPNNKEDKDNEINLMQNTFLSNVNPLLTLFHSFESKDDMNSYTYEDYTAYEMTRFIRTNINELKKNAVGEYLSSSKPFNIKVITSFINSFNFKDIHLVDALRILFSEFPICGEGQIIDRIVQIFGQKYFKDCKNSKEYKNIYKNPDDGYYVAFSVIMLNTDLHREEVDKKMSLNEYLSQVKELVSDALDDNYLKNVYKRIQDSPLVIPGQKIVTNKNKKELMQQEKDTIIKLTQQRLSKALKSNAYTTDIDNDNIKQLLDNSWSNFLGIFSQLLADYDDETTVANCINNILLISRTCGILHLDTIAEAFINTVVNLTYLMEGRQMTMKNIQCSQALIEFVVKSGMYIKTCWYNILNFISKIDYYQTIGGSFKTESDLFIKEIRRRSKLKNPEKEIEIELANCDLVYKNINSIGIENVFTKTHLFNEEGIVNFVSNLCKVTHNEISHVNNPRVYSLHKLVEVAEFNISRIQIEWVKIWKLISESLVNVITACPHESILSDAIDTLRQTVNKLLQKPDKTMQSYQMDLFKPFERIFDLSKKPNQIEMILMCIEFLIQQPEKIHSGWIVIFRILKKGLTKKNSKQNKIILKILQSIFDHFYIFTNTTTNSLNFDVFRGYIECLYYIDLDEQLKPIAFEMITKVMKKIIEDISKEKDKMQQYDLVLIFFFGFDGLVSVNPIEHVNLIFELIDKNKDVLMKNESFFYLYYCYFKPHLCSMLLYFFEYRCNVLSDENRKRYELYHKERSIDDILFNLKLYLEESLESDLNHFINDNGSSSNKDYGCFSSMIMKKGTETEDNKDDDVYVNEKTEMISFIKNIKSVYDKESDLLKSKLDMMKEFDEKNYELSLEFFIEKFLELINNKTKEKNVEDNQQPNAINYYSFYEDLLVTLTSLSIFTTRSKTIFKIIQKNIISSSNTLSQYTWNRINKETNFILSSIASINTNISMPMTDTELNDLLHFISSFADFYSLLLNFSNKNANSKQTELRAQYKLLNSLMMKLLMIDIENNYKGFSIVNSSIAIDILSSIAKIRKCLIDKEDDISLLHDDSSMFGLENLHKVFVKYQLYVSDNHPLLDVILFELESIVSPFLKYFNKNELEEVFKILMDLVDSNNEKIRKAAKLIMNQYCSNRLCVFVAFNNR